ncbi:Vms1/Ankzf1 family peptidyl-tRNA hydrolase [Halorhabdus amylolytica]|uniref:Vms1/Ankzf1 family peptidyl-tRNA hydrolase n=1 Tax=Halorhabdus amylolytica TaxID=2559573 RepID=UPI0010AAB3B7|nr:Vms1/Ankzf1 family peptidyl-tRNA hydrolase [Halorhabdus amylolytica]
MLDDILGKTELRERIEDLEERNEDLQRQLDAESQRRVDAVTARQEAQREVNRLQDRVTELEDRVERLQSGERRLDFRREETLRGERLDVVLSRLDSFETGEEGALSAYVADGSLPAPVSDAFGERAALVSRVSPCYVFVDDAGMCSVALEPPIAPEPFVTWDEEFRVDRSTFQPQGEYTLALIRSDLFAMGVYRGRERVAFHGFDSDLGRNHSKGGFSQARFERLRDERIDDHLERCRVALQERTTDRLYVVGERTVLDEVDEDADVTATVDATGDPEPALGDAFRDFWTTTLYAI